jgi:hypothetical protein
MPALGEQMHLHGNPSLLQRNVVSQRVVYVVHVVILSLQQKRRRCLAGDRNIGIQRKIFIGIGEVIPAAKISVTKDGLFDVQTESRNSATIIEIKRVN